MSSVDPTAAYRKQQGMAPITQSYDPKVVGWVVQAAKETGADPRALLATAIQESGARTGAVGDNGTSFGPFQMHQGGALGTHDAAWANSYGAVLNRAQEFAKDQVHHGVGAAAVQRPADRSLYARGVDSHYQQAAAILAHFGLKMPTGAAPGVATPATPLVASQPQRTAPITLGSIPGVQTNDNADIGVPMLQSILDSNAKLAGISSIQLPVATPIAPRKTPAPVHVTPSAQGTGGLDAAGQAIVNVARKYLGTAYRWGGSTPKTGFDCSGLLQWAAAQSGIKIPRTTYQQIKAGQPVALSQLRPGDAVFFGTTANPHHVGVAVGGGKFIEAPHTGSVVRISSLAGRSDILAARRYA